MSPAATWSKPSTGRSKALKVLRLAAGGDGGKGAAVKGALEGDQPIALRRALRRVIAPRHLDRAFHGFRAGIGEEHIVGEGRLAEPRREPLLPRDPVQIRHVPELFACSVRASTRCGWAWPSAVTATPEAKSR